MAAMEFRPPDVVPLQVCAAPGGLHEHGQKLVDLVKACGHDFGDLTGLTLPAPPGPEDRDPDGRYHAIRTDGWGTTWEYRIFGVWGHPLARPLDDLSKLDSYVPPAVPRPEGPDFEAAKVATAVHKRTYFSLAGTDCLLERMCALRRFEEVLMDIALDTPEINRIADIVCGVIAANARWGLALDADAIAFGSDFGTQTALIVSPQAWRRFFKPRLRALFEPVLRAGKRICFHSCGQISAILEDLREIGVDAIWPQLPLFDLRELSRICHDLRIAVQLHPDRGDLMQRGTPRQVRDYVHRLLDVFGTADGGSWLYIETDPGFPYANVEALFETAMALRR